MFIYFSEGLSIGFILRTLKVQLPKYFFFQVQFIL